MKQVKVVVDGVEILIDEKKRVSVIHASSVQSIFTKKEGGISYIVDAGPGVFDLDIVLYGADGNPGSGKSVALVVEGKKVFAQTGVGSWSHRYELHPTPTPAPAQ
jgi:hypothetical protein